MPMRSDLLQLLGAKARPDLPSAAPGTGPAERDTTIQNRPGFLGGPNPAIPKTTPETNTGFGGSGDPNTTAPNVVSYHRRPPSIGGITKPTYNDLASPLRTADDAWRFINRGYSTGSWTPAVGTQLFKITLTQSNPIPLRLMQYPGALSCYWVVQMFSFAPEAVTMTGCQEFYYLPPKGDNYIPLGIYTGNVGGTYGVPILADSSITDMNDTTVGQLIVVGDTIATPVTCHWQIGVGLAYLIPHPDHLYDVDRGATEQMRAVQKFAPDRLP